MTVPGARCWLLRAGKLLAIDQMWSRSAAGETLALPGCCSLVGRLLEGWGLRGARWSERGCLSMLWRRAKRRLWLLHCHWEGASSCPVKVRRKTSLSRQCLRFHCTTGTKHFAGLLATSQLLSLSSGSAAERQFNSRKYYYNRTGLQMAPIPKLDVFL